MSDKTIIKISNLSKSFKTKCVLNNISLKVNEGEIFGVMGPNGSGKTLLINTLLGLISPSAGDIKIFGKSLSKNLKFIHTQVNAASTYYRLLDEMSIIGNLLTYANLYGVTNPLEKINKLLDILDLRKFVEKNQRISTLSSGENFRLILCKALLNDPKILFLDEPTASLDPITATKIRTAISHIHKTNNTTIFLASHNINEISSLCTRVGFLKKGKIIKIVDGKNAKTMLNLY